MPESEFQDVILDLLHLRKGRHKSAADGMSPMEAVAWLAGEKHSDHPDCTCPVIAAYVRPISDWASYYQRQQLRAFLPRLIGSRSADHVVLRAEFLVRQAATVFLPLMYDEFKQSEIAAALRALPSAATPVQFRDSIRSARRSFSAAAAAAAYAYAAAAAADAASVAADDAAADAADAAYAAATDTADAADAADAATNAADAAAVAAGAAVVAATAVAADMAVGQTAWQKLWEAALAALDGALTIGPAGPVMLTPDMIERLKAYWTLHQTSA